jgi:hypothetical protein
VKRPDQILPRRDIDPVFPPTELSTIASNVVGTCTKSMPRSHAAAANPPRSPITPPPAATSTPPRSSLFSARKSNTRPSPASDLAPSPASTASTGASPNIARNAPACARTKLASVSTATLRPAARHPSTACRTSPDKSVPNRIG